MHTIGLLLRVVAVFALLGGTLWVLRRGVPGQRRTSMVQVVESVRLGKSASASLLKVGETTYLVGVTDHGVALLAEPRLAEQTEAVEVSVPVDATEGLQLDLLAGEDDAVPQPVAAAAAPTAAPAGPPTMAAFLTTVARRLVTQLRALRSRLDADATAEAARKARPASRPAGVRKPTLAAFTAAFGQQLRQLRPRPQLAAAGAGGPALVLDAPRATAAPSFDALLADELEALDQPADEPPARSALLAVVPDAEDEYDDEDEFDEFDELDDLDDAEDDDAVAAAPEAESLAQLARQLQMLDTLPKTPPVQTVADGPAPVVVPAPRPAATVRSVRSSRTDAPRFIDEEHPWSLPCRRARQHTGPRTTSLV